MLTILIFLVVLGLLVLVHELGHFLTARFFGIKADEFGFGFPPRMLGIVKDDVSGRYKIVWGNKNIQSRSTLYSLNWLPLGGFVKIKGEDASFATEPDSFAHKAAGKRITVLAAGVIMNFFLAWVLFSIVFTLGLPTPIDPGQRDIYPEAKIQILDIKKDSPAASMGLQLGDELVAINGEAVKTLDMVHDTIVSHKGEKVTIEVNRLGKTMTLIGVPRVDYPSNEGALGISFSETAIVSYPWHQAIGEGLRATYRVTLAIVEAFGKMIASIFGGEKVPVDVTGPVGIVYLTKQMSDLGLPYLLQFAALLSINLAIINILPIPALDGGRILFILIEKLKGSPVSQKTEGVVHQVGFILLLLLMFFITVHDFSQYHILEKLSRLF